jgi:Fis family transcriptional regulator, factor for inversion stimulation protein
MAKGLGRSVTKSTARRTNGSANAGMTASGAGTTRSAKSAASVSAARFAYPTSERVSRARSGETLEQCVLRSLDQYFADLDGSRPHALLDMVTTAVERPLLQFAMNRCDGNQCAAAELLGINRNTLRKKLQQYRLL